MANPTHEELEIVRLWKSKDADQLSAVEKMCIRNLQKDRPELFDKPSYDDTHPAPPAAPTAQRWNSSIIANNSMARNPTLRDEASQAPEQPRQSPSQPYTSSTSLRSASPASSIHDLSIASRHGLLNLPQTPSRVRALRDNLQIGVDGHSVIPMRPRSVDAYLDQSGVEDVWSCSSPAPSARTSTPAAETRSTTPTQPPPQTRMVISGLFAEHIDDLPPSLRGREGLTPEAIHKAAREGEARLNTMIEKWRNLMIEAVERESDICQWQAQVAALRLASDLLDGSRERGS